MRVYRSRAPSPHFQFSVLKRKGKILDWGWRENLFLWEADDTIPQNSYIPYQDLWDATLHCKKNHIGSAVSEIIRYKQIDSLTKVLLLLYKVYYLSAAIHFSARLSFSALNICLWSALPLPHFSSQTWLGCRAS